MKFFTAPGNILRKIEYLLLSCFILFFSASLFMGCFGTPEKRTKDSSITLIPDDSSFLVLNFAVNDYELKETEENGTIYTDVVFNDGVRLNKKGFASLPFLHASVQLPPMGEVNYEIMEEEYVDIPLEHPFMPSKGTIYRNQNPEDIERTVDPASFSYSTYPVEIVTMTDPYIFRDVRGINVYVHPFRYDALNNILRVYSKLKISLNLQEQATSKNSMNQHPSSVVNEMKPIYESMFINYGSLNSDPFIQRSFSHEIAEFGELLVLHTSRDASAITPYVEWKRQLGYKVYTKEVATGTNAAGIIKTEYTNNNNLLYVQLVGDWADIKSNLGTGQNAPMDPMLGCVSGTDNYPDLIIGRFSAENTVHLTTQINKDMAYEKNPDLTGTWYTSALGLGSAEGPGDDSEKDYAHIDNINNYRLKATTYANTLRYSDSDSYTKTRDAVNNGVSVINYCGHGDYNKFVTTNFTSTEVNNLTNGAKLPFIFSVACVNGKFHGTAVSFAETWLRKDNGGAVATIMATINQPWYPPMRGQDYMNDLLTGGYNYPANTGSGTSTTEGRTTFGSITFNALVLMYAESSATEDLETIQTWTIFGDAALQVRTAKPKPIAISNQNVTAGQGFSARVTSENTDVTGARVTLSQGSAIYTGLTNSSGYVTLSHSLSSGTAKLVVSGFNLNTLVYDVTVNTGTNIPPAAEFTFAKNELTVQFTDASTDSNGSIAGQLWKFGDGQTSTEVNPQHTYLQAGTYTVELTVTDNEGASNSTTKSVTVIEAETNTPPIASFTYSANEFAVQFTDSSTDAEGPIASRLWNFGDNQTSSSANPLHTYAAEGTYSVTLTVTDEGGLTNSHSTSISVVKKDDPLVTVEEFNNIAVAYKAENHYSFNVVPGTNFKAVMTGTNDADLYVRYGSAPTQQAYDCRPFKSGSSETCEGMVPGAIDKAFVMVVGYQASTYNLSVTYTKAGDIPDDPVDPGIPTVKVAEYTSQTITLNVYQYYQPVPVIQGTTLNVTMSGTGNGDLYVRYNAAPTKSSYDAISNLGDSNESVSSVVPAGVTKAYVMVFASSDAAYDLKIEHTQDAALDLINSYADQSVAVGLNNYYGPFDIIPGKSYSAAITGSGDADLYTRHTSKPDKNNYLCRPYLGSSNEECTTSSVPAGTSKLYIMVNGYKASAYTLTVSIKN